MKKRDESATARQRIEAVLMLASGLCALVGLSHGVLHLSTAVTAGAVETAALFLAPAAVVAGLARSLRREGALAVLLRGAVLTAAAAVSAILVGAAVLFAGASVEMAAARTDAGARTAILIHEITTRRERLAALLRARLRAVASTLAARLLPAPRAAVLIPRTA